MILGRRKKFILGCIKANGMEWVERNCRDLGDGNKLKKDIICLSSSEYKSKIDAIGEKSNR